MTEKCGDTHSIGDDYGDNDATFRCDKEEDHKEKEHSETTATWGYIIFTMTWEYKDCVHCDKKIIATWSCANCKNPICSDCATDKEEECEN